MEDLVGQDLFLVKIVLREGIDFRDEKLNHGEGLTEQVRCDIRGGCDA